MHVIVPGGSGFVGRHLVRALLDRGDLVTVVTRDPPRARRLGDRRANYRGWLPPFAGIDAVVNLVGEPVLGRRWTPTYKQTLRDSRLQATRRVVRALEAAPEALRPRVLVNASAVGFYGDRGNEPLPERAEPGRGFLAELCVDWEAAARQTSARSVQLRLGIVLGRGGGALASMLPIFRKGLGGPLGLGRQFMPWVHVDDVVGLVLAALDTERYAGPVNATSPGVVTNAEFTRALGRTLRRPALLPAPSPALRLLLGEGADVLLASQRCVPEAAQQHGYGFRQPEIAAALAELLSG